jgi:hypothetical protein
MDYLSSDIQPVNTTERTFEPSPAAPDIHTYSPPIQMHFLARLQRLEEARGQMESLPCQDVFMKKHVGCGLFVTYRECVDEGVGVEARQILKIRL